MNLKLSEAIREGAKLHPPTEHGWDDKDANGIPRTCALVAACEAAGVVYYDGHSWQLGPNGKLAERPPIDARTGAMMGQGSSIQMPQRWAVITESMALPPCPCQKHGVFDAVIIIIWHLHDIHRWSREAVAEWIATFEESIEGASQNTQSNDWIDKKDASEVMAEKT